MHASDATFSQLVTRYKGTNLHSTIIFFQKFLYVFSPCKSRRVIYGEMPVCYKGIDFTKQQLDSGSKKFSSIYSGDILNTFVNDDSDHDSNYDDDDSDDEMISENTTMDTCM